jgi:hypothetical protein
MENDMRSFGERQPLTRVVGWLIAGVVFLALVVGLVWMLVSGELPSETIDGRPPRRGWRRRRIDNAVCVRGSGFRVEGRVPGRWSGAAAQEAAPAVAFEQLRLELRVLGAPAELVHRAGVAADDERRHAARCRAMAHLAGEVPAGERPLAAPELPRDCRSRAGRCVRVAQIAVESHLDGSLNERRAAQRIRATAVTSPAPFGALLAAIAEDEDRHAALADDVIAWTRVDGGRLTALALALVDWRSKAHLT